MLVTRTAERTEASDPVVELKSFELKSSAMKNFALETPARERRRLPVRVLQ
jgi:hypothetical protein